MNRLYALGCGDGCNQEHMSLKNAERKGLHLLPAFLLMASLFLALSVFPRETGAHPCPPAHGHSDFHGVNCEELGHDTPHREVTHVDAGQALTADLALKAYIPNEPGRHYLNDGDRVRITLPGFDLSRARFREPGDGGAPFDRIIIGDSADANMASPAGVIASGDTLTLVLPDLHMSHAHEPGEHLVITIRKETGILAPRLPRGFDDDARGYLVEIVFIDMQDGPGGREVAADDRNIIVAGNPVSSSVPGATVRVRLAVFAESGIHRDEDITVDFSGPDSESSFTVPESIDESRVQMRYLGRTFTPSEVLVQGDKVVLTLPEKDGPELVRGEYLIVFKQSAGIRNPLAAGNRTIVVSSFAGGDVDDEIIAVIKRTTETEPAGGVRGSEFTLTGKGYARGTVTIFGGDDAEIDPGETLASARTDKGVFRVRLTAGGRAGESGYRVNAVDSSGAVASLEFSIKESMSFSPASARAGSGLRIDIADWEGGGQGVAAVRIAGRTAYIAGVRQYAGCVEYTGLLVPGGDGKITLDVTVPRNVPAGEQTVSVYGPNQLRDLGKDRCGPEADGDGAWTAAEAELEPEPAPVVTAILEVEVRPLEVSPDTAARGQRITVTGPGFARGRAASGGVGRVTIGGRDVLEDPSVFDVSSGGYVTMTVTVPESIPDGPNEVRVEGIDGSIGMGKLTVPEAAITVEPGESRRGTEISGTGSGFIAHAPVRVTYGGGGAGGAFLGSVLSDSNGRFSFAFTAPAAAEIGMNHRVTAVAAAGRGPGMTQISAEASHTILAGAITVTPGSALPGESVTVRGDGLPPFRQVTSLAIEGMSVPLVSYPATGRTGAFVLEFIVPRVEPGSRTLQIEVGGVVTTQKVEILAPVLNGPPREVFKELITAGALERVWRFEEAGQSWALFDPRPEFASLTSLTEVGSGDFLWVRMAVPHPFQGNALTAGWNPIELE